MEPNTFVGQSTVGSQGRQKNAHAPSLRAMHGRQRLEKLDLRSMVVYPGADVHLSDCTFRQDVQFAIYVAPGASLTLVNCVFENCAIGIFVRDKCNVRAEKAQFRACSSAGLYAEGPDTRLELSYCTFVKSPLNLYKGVHLAILHSDFEFSGAMVGKNCHGELTACTFRNCSTGLEILRSKKLLVQLCAFFACGFGIFHVWSDWTHEALVFRESLKRDIY